MESHIISIFKGAYSGLPLSRQPVVAIRDAGKNIVTSDLTTTITATLVNTGYLNGAKLLTANDNIMGPFSPVTHGVLYWQRLQVDKSGNFSLNFTSSLDNCIPATSVFFQILPSSPSKLAVVKDPDDCVMGQPCKIQPVVEVQDLQGNKVPVTRKFNASLVGLSCAFKVDFKELSFFDGTCIAAKQCRTLQ